MTDRLHPTFKARNHRQIGGALKAGTELVDGQAVSVFIPLAGAARWRIRAQFSCAGTLSAAYLRPNSRGHLSEVYATDNPDDVAFVADTENKMEESQHFGEAAILLTFTPSANGTVTFVDICEV